jgi:hypothetical protein
VRSAEREGEQRAQTTLVGVGVLLAVTVLAVGGLTVAVGQTVERGAAAADAGRVADDAVGLASPTDRTGRVRLRFADGRVETVAREVRVLNRTRVVRTVDVGGVVYERGRHRVAVVAGAVVRGRGDDAWVHTAPRVRRADGTLLVSVVALGTDPGRGVGGAGSDGVTVETATTHERAALPDGADRVAVETSTPAAWERAFAAADAAGVERRDFDGDGVVSVVGSFPRSERAFLAVHRLHAEVRAGG